MAKKKPPFEYDEDALIKALIEGRISTKVLPQNLYFKIAEYLKEGMYEGWEGNLTSTMYASDKLLLRELRTNIYQFSAAKTYQQVREMSAVLGKGKNIATFKEAKESAKIIFKTYNETYLRTEYDTAIGQAQNARKWAEFERDAPNFDLLEYDAVLDLNTSEICRPLDGIRLPINDPFWNTHSPLNHFNCRCLLRKVSDVLPTKKSDVAKAVKQTDPLMQDTFKMNPGKDGYIFSKKHPYFQVAPKDKGQLKMNFGLPIPEKD